MSSNPVNSSPNITPPPTERENTGTASRIQRATRCFRETIAKMPTRYKVLLGGLLIVGGLAAAAFAPWFVGVLGIGAAFAGCIYLGSEKGPIRSKNSGSPPIMARHSLSVL